MRVVADEFDPLGVVSHCVEHAPQWRAGKSKHQGGANQGVGSNQVVQLDLRAVSDAQGFGASDPVARHTALAAKKFRKHQRHRPNQLTHTQGNHGKRGCRFFGGNPAQYQRHCQPGKTACNGHQTHRYRQTATADLVQGVNCQKRTHARIHRVTKTKHAALPQQHVVGQANNDCYTHLAEHGVAQGRSKNQRRQNQNQSVQTPDQKAAHVQRFKGVNSGFAVKNFQIHNINLRVNLPACPASRAA